jgi:SAM-dependent methyltransferase
MFSSGSYILPKDQTEDDRLDLQHHFYRLILRGNYCAPLRQPRMILDVACGTGIWGREMAREFPQTQVINFDIDRAPVDAALQRLGPTGQIPANFRFLEADAFQPFPFEPGLFDFTHARLIGSFTPVARWPDVVAEMIRVTRPGGYVELVDFEIGQSPSQAVMALGEAMGRLMTARGLHPGSAPYLAGYLRQAGLEGVRERRAIVGGGPRGSREQGLLITDILATFANLQPLVVKVGVLSDADYTALLERAREEARALGAWLPIVCAFGRKPLERGRRSGFIRY